MELNKQQLKSKLNKNVFNKIIEDKYVIQTGNPIQFLTPERFDLIAKYIYVKHKDINSKSNFAKELYLKHIEVFNGFYEADESNKIGEVDFLKSFDTLIDSIKNKGFDKKVVIPINNSQIALDGAHRLAICLYLNKDIQYVNVQLESKSFNYKYFLNAGLDICYLDEMALEYINIKQNNLYLVFIWPTSGGKHENDLKKILNKYGTIVYRKNIFLTKRGSVNLIRNLYKQEDWLGNAKNEYIGAQNKANWCFEKEGYVRVFLFESDKSMVNMKDEVRDIFKVSKHSIHITDTPDEVTVFSKLVFNDNTVHWMNFSGFTEYSWFNKLFKHYKNWLKNNNNDINDFCVDGSSTLSAYGIRPARDLDFFYSGTQNVSTGFKEIDCHNIRLDNVKESLDDQIYNPKNYFYFDSFKFISLENLIAYKKERGEEKDLEDLNKIYNLINDKSLRIPFIKRIKLVLNPSYWKGKIKFKLLKARYYMVKIRRNAKN